MTEITKQNSLSLDQYIIKYIKNAVEQSIAEGSYGVGGMLLNIETGAVIKVMYNTVISKEEDEQIKRLKDPTAHGERQLVDWYYENRNNVEKPLPDPEKILLITSLDPCCMCTGSILTAGFKTIVVALDEKAGINWDNLNKFSPLEDKVGEKIRNSFIYPKVVDNEKRKDYGEVPYFTSKTISKSNLIMCEEGFNEGAKHARDIIGNVIDKSNLKDISDNSSDVAKNCREKLINSYSNALKYRAKVSDNPDEGLAQYLIDAAEQDKEYGGDGDAVALLDYFGNLLMCKSGRKYISPIRTALMETIRAYQKVRYELTANNNEALYFLHEPKYCTFVFMKGFDKSSQSFADLGAYGSVIFKELDNPTNLQYIFPRIKQAELESYIQNMPPRYKNLLKPMQVRNIKLIEKCKMIL